MGGGVSFGGRDADETKDEGLGVCVGEGGGCASLLSPLVLPRFSYIFDVLNVDLVDKRTDSAVRCRRIWRTSRSGEPWQVAPTLAALNKKQYEVFRGQQTLLRPGTSTLRCFPYM